MIHTPLLVFLSFNVLRTISIACLLMVFAATIQSMVLDGRYIMTAEPDDWLDCDYIPDTDVPTHAWGIFWAHLDRVFILILCLLGFMSEINWGGICERAFQHCLPIFGLTYGLSALGSLQMMVGASLLSRYLDTFALVTAWLLFFVGLVHMLLGLAFGARVKAWRSFTRSVRVRAWEHPESGQQFAGSAGQGYWSSAKGEKAELDRAFALGGSDRLGGTHCNRTERDLEQAVPSGAQPVRTLSEAFARARQAQSARGPSVDTTESILSPSYDEVMRARAREANERFEQAQEAQLGRDLRGDPSRAGSPASRIASEPTLSGGFVYDSHSGVNILLGRARSIRHENRFAEASGATNGAVNPSQHPRFNASDRDARVPVSIYEHPSRATSTAAVPSPPYCPTDSSPVADRRHGRLPASIASTRRAAAASAQAHSQADPDRSVPSRIKRRSLALASAARKRLSGSSSKGTRSVYSQGRSVPPPMPSLTQRRLARAVERQAEKERDRLRRLARELKLPTSPGKISRPRWHASDASPSSYSRQEEEDCVVVHHSPTNASTDALTSVSRAVDRFAQSTSRQETGHRARKPSLDVEHPLPAYQPANVHRTEPAWDGGEDLGLGALHGHHDARLPIASHFASEWARP